MNKTIYALSTAPGTGAIHIVRVSGPKTFNILNKICKTEVFIKHFHIQRNVIWNSKTQNVIDDVLLMKFVAPNTYTGEDLIEINCHGSMQIVHQIFELLAANGAILASPGEFTKRGFLNNKMDLTQAAAVDVLVKSLNPYSRACALASLFGKTSKQLTVFQNEIFQLIGTIEVLIDYPEYEDLEKDLNTWINKTKNLKQKLIAIINQSSRLISINSGFKIAIIGEPNVGKSSLLNALLNKERAIVSNVAGTTRDVIEAYLEINQFPVSLLDTAGIHEHRSQLEKKGIEKTHETIKEANLVILVLDANKKSSTHLEILNDLTRLEKKYILCYNKKDLIKTTQIKPETNCVLISAKNNEINDLIQQIESYLEEYKQSSNNLMLNQKWQIDLANQCVYFLDEFERICMTHPYLDLIIEPLKNANESLLKILGKIQNYDLITEIFKNFCLGK